MTVPISPVPPPYALLREYVTEMVGRYHGRPATGAEVDAAVAEDPSDDLYFLVAYHGDGPAGCVALRALSDRVGEIKRMYVRPAVRGRGIGVALLDAVEREAVGRGLVALRLDTRHDLVEARTLYRRQGYLEIPPYNANPYAQHWLEKALVRPGTGYVSRAAAAGSPTPRSGRAS